MSERERVMKAIYAAVEELNNQLPISVRVEKSLDAPLYGKSSKLESIDLVGFIIEVEDKIKEEFGVPITIVDEKAMSQQHSPFLTLGTLTDYLDALLGANAGTTSRTL